MSKLNKILAITNLILWTGLLISLFCVNYNANCLKDFAVCSTFIVIMDIGFDLLGSRKEKQGEK